MLELRYAAGGSDIDLPEVERDHPLDGEQGWRRLLRQLLEWLYYERDRQAANRLEQAMDEDMYHGLQWSPEDAAAVRERGQMPLVFNEVAPMIDWLIGTERRTRVDWRVLPRTPDDVQLAEVKTRALKYVADVNGAAMARSQAFADAVRAGIGWIDDGVRDDPTAEPIYSRHEDWRCVLHDSTARELDLSDARYIFRWRWVDEDVACAMYPDRADVIRRSGIDRRHDVSFDDADNEGSGWPAPSTAAGEPLAVLGSGSASVDARRRRVRIYEAQYRMPTPSAFVAEGPLKGVLVDARDGVLAQHITGCALTNKVAMRVHVAVFVEDALLRAGPSPYRHNRFSLTPVWCYRRGRDRLPYGAARRVRDIQLDINKRASKAQFLLNTNQIIAEDGAVDDWNEAREEANRPDGLIIRKSGKDFQIRRGDDVAAGQVQMMALQARAVQKIAGVAEENLGRPTNAVSGRAIEARQIQGSVVVTEPFDNLRAAVQESGRKQLALVEQFMVDERVVRLTGKRAEVEWLRLNVPQVQPDGSLRYLDDITASAADFVVSEQDYAGSMRQVMFESLHQIAQRLPPEVALKLLAMAYEYSDLPNHQEIADAVRRMTGERDPEEPVSPEEEQAAQAQAQAQAEALQLQREAALAQLKEQQAKVRKLVAEAMKIEAEVAAKVGAGAPQQEQAQQALLQVRRDADAAIERLSADLQRAQTELANRAAQAQADAQARLDAARIEADARIRVAEIQARHDERVAKLRGDVEQMRARATEAPPADGQAAPAGDAPAPTPLAPPLEPAAGA